MFKSIFNNVSGNHPRLNRFDLSYTNTTSCKLGILYPVQVDEVLPGDVWKMSDFVHVQMAPLLNPIMCDIQLFVHTFFVPYRLLYGYADDGKSVWEHFITGDPDGDYDTPLPAWSPNWTSTGYSSGKIWDYIGLPVSYSSSTWAPIVPAGVPVSIAPKRAYNFIYNCFYRDEFLVDEVSLDNEDLLSVAFKKDYFTSALENQLQGGVSSALPVIVSGQAPVTWSSVAGTAENFQVNGFPYGKILPRKDHLDQLSISASSNSTVADDSVNDSASISAVKGIVDFNNAVATTYSVSEFRLAFATQRVLELNQRAGVRYVSFLKAHYGVNPRDDRLDRPEYIGGNMIPVSVSTVVQTSSTDSTTPQGNKSGVGSIDAVQKIGNYRVLEHGLIMTLVSFRPKPIYKQGVNRQWLHTDRFSFYTPEFAYLSESGIYNCEIFTGGSGDVDSDGNYLDNQIFGYQAAWNELRSKNNIVSGAVREQLANWTMAREFSTRPALNQQFIEIDDNDFNYVFANGGTGDEFVLSYGAINDVYRPLPVAGVPGLIDHVYGG